LAVLNEAEQAEIERQKSQMKVAGRRHK
jgi:hypothetical protein